MSAIVTEMKVCTKCKVLLSVSEFNKDRHGTDGLSSQCRVCRRVALRIYHCTPESKASNRAYAKIYNRSVARRELNRIHSRYVRRRYPEKIKARNAVTKAIYHDQLSKASNFSCTRCGSSAHQYHHHLGYSPEHYLDVIPLCRSCHKQLDSPVGIGVLI